MQSKHSVLLQWLIGAGVVLLALYIAFREGLFALLLDSDRSYLSLAILMAFCFANLHIAYRVFKLSVEHNILQECRCLLTNHRSFYCDDTHQLHCNGQILPAAFITQHITNLIARLSAQETGTESAKLQTHLLSALQKRIFCGHKFGWMLADIMVKLGLVGTVVGFVIMLGSIASLQHYDIETMQDLLGSMSGGMRVALFTTLTGLISGLLLAIQYQFLDYHSETLLADIEELSEVHIIPRLLAESH